jgi:hypothetical protein
LHWLQMPVQMKIWFEVIKIHVKLFRCCLLWPMTSETLCPSYKKERCLFIPLTKIILFWSIMLWTNKLGPNSLAFGSAFKIFCLFCRCLLPRMGFEKLECGDRIEPCLFLWIRIHTPAFIDQKKILLIKIFWTKSNTGWFHTPAFIDQKKILLIISFEQKAIPVGSS